jgi:hypothetical protein
MRQIRTPLTLLLILAVQLPLNSALAQEGPTTPPIPGAEAPAPKPWSSTVGFELKTTTHNSTRTGRTDAHTLMKYVIPKEGFNWTEDQKRIVEKWDRLDVKERTKFFFENYKGGHNATNFVTDARKVPYLDGSVSWYESMNIPHIEVRSKPFDSKEEALKRMGELKSSVKETIAFHTHYRFPYDPAKIQPNAEAVTDYLRRVSWSIWLRRATVSSRSDFVLKSMDNTPVNVGELEKALKIFEADGLTAKKDIIERRGIRVNRLSNADGTASLDIEFRGLMKDTKRIERYVEMTDKAFRTGEFGPFSYNSESAFRGHEAKDVLKFYTFGWHGKGTLGEAELDYLSKQVEKFRAENGIRTTLSPEEVKAAVRHMATADTDAGKKMLMPTSWEWLFMPLENDRALPTEVQKGYKKARARYIKKLIKLAERVKAGEFGKPTTGPLAESVTSNKAYKPEAVASRTRKILLDFAKESYSAGGKKGNLADWYETSLFEPKKVETLNRAYRGREGFAGRRTGSGTPGTFDRAEVKKVFETLRGVALESTGMRAAESAPGSDARKVATAGLLSVAETSMEISADKALNIEFDRARNKVVVSEGLLGEIANRALKLPAAERPAFRNKVLGLMMGHELSHSAGITAERVADGRAVDFLRGAPELYTSKDGTVRPLTEADIKSTVRTFTEAGTAFENVLYRMKNLARYGTTSGREGELLRAARGGADPLSRFRRADGTLDWKRVTASKALQHGTGAAHFALALFLKELAVVVQTGDRLRIEEFFDGLMTTDFFVTYGLFSVGAHAGNVAYSKHLSRFVKPQFISGILRTNIVLATGMALPEIAHGTFEGKAFAISVASLGLSTTAVKAGLSGIKWVVDLSKVNRLGAVASSAAKLRKYAKVGGWFYTAVETAVVLYLGDEINKAINNFLDDRAARSAIVDASNGLFNALGKDGRDDFDKALEKFGGTHEAYRNHLYKGMAEEEARYYARLEKLARSAKLMADKRGAIVAKMEKYPALKSVILRKHGSIENYIKSLQSKDEAELDGQVKEIMKSYNDARNTILHDVYTKDKRSTNESYLSSGHAEWLAGGSRVGSEGDPFSGRKDLAARWGRDKVRSDFDDDLKGISKNRIEAYSDELAVLALAAKSAKNPDHRRAIEKRMEMVKVMKGKDEKLGVSSDGTLGAIKKAIGE